jgi:hypothetical protein
MKIVCYSQLSGILNKVSKKGDVAMKSINILNKVNNTQSLKQNNYKQNNEICYGLNNIWISCNGIRQ